MHDLSFSLYELAAFARGLRALSSALLNSTAKPKIKTLPSGVTLVTFAGEGLQLFYRGNPPSISSMHVDFEVIFVSDEVEDWLHPEVRPAWRAFASILKEIAGNLPLQSPSLSDVIDLGLLAKITQLIDDLHRRRLSPRAATALRALHALTKVATEEEQKND